MSAEELVGTWRLGGTYLALNEDGSARVVDRVEDLQAPVDEDRPGALTAWSYDGTIFSVQTVRDGMGEGYDTCKADSSGIYFVERVEDTNIQFKVLQDSCPDRYFGLPWGPWEPTSP